MAPLPRGLRGDLYEGGHIVADDHPVPTPRFHQIVKDAQAIARAMGHSYAGVEHLFLAILRDPEAVPTQTLSELISVETVSSHLEEVMRSPSYLGIDE
ncbi:Clp protease N-terminal domain-containing protein [Streptomyces sp. PsTaAH-124]|uniref:Clp protease N-terminal domain-containing protein n=1 Tax=Streptomyces sp. PsTaAH-124 TaxID=1157638 RepID=UPI003B63D13A